jgi:hypothetical protein
MTEVERIERALYLAACEARRLAAFYKVPFIAKVRDK